jgi:S1-C subfamily serine protease
MDLSEEHQESGTVEPLPTHAERRISRGQILRDVFIVALVLIVGATGYFIGRAQNTASAPVTASPATPRLPAGGYGNFGNFGNFPNSPTFPAQQAPTSKADAATAKIATSVDPGLVDINTQISYQQSAGAGTGMIVSHNGLVLTNNHVIDGATSISARVVATGKVYKATVVGYDISSDVAVLKLQNASGLSTIKTDTGALTKGESVVGIGNAGGAGGTPSFAAGKVVAVGQSITANDEENPNGAESLNSLIETNADIQAGDSGGALVNTRGKVIGMDTAAGSANEGPIYNSDSSSIQAFAIPIKTVLAIASSIENGDSSSTVHVGATALLGIDIAPSTSDQFGNYAGGSADTTSGVTIAGIAANSPASNSALATGDVIVSVDGQSVSTLSSLESILQTLRPGDTVKVGYTNNNNVQATLKLQLGSGPPQ